MILATGRHTGDVTHMIVVITDGSSINTYRTGQESLAAQENFIRMYSLGVGQNTFLYELERIASDESSLLTINSFFSLLATTDFIETICEGKVYDIYIVQPQKSRHTALIYYCIMILRLEVC